jgi:hypothetical protein
MLFLEVVGMSVRCLLGRLFGARRICVQKFGRLGDIPYLNEKNNDEESNNWKWLAQYKGIL